MRDGDAPLPQNATISPAIQKAILWILVLAGNIMFFLQEWELAMMAVYATLPGAVDPVWKTFVANHWDYYSSLFDAVVGLHIAFNLGFVLRFIVLRRCRVKQLAHSGEASALGHEGMDGPGS